MGLPQTSTLPSSARSAPTRQRSRVDLPAPLRPVSAIASPVRTSRLNLSKMVFGPEGPAQAGHLEDRRAFGHGRDSASFRQGIRA